MAAAPEAENRIPLQEVADHKLAAEVTATVADKAAEAVEATAAALVVADVAVPEADAVKISTIEAKSDLA